MGLQHRAYAKWTTFGNELYLKSFRCATCACIWKNKKICVFHNLLSPCTRAAISITLEKYLRTNDALTSRHLVHVFIYSHRRPMLNPKTNNYLSLALPLAPRARLAIRWIADGEVFSSRPGPHSTSTVMVMTQQVSQLSCRSWMLCINKFRLRLDCDSR